MDVASGMLSSRNDGFSLSSGDFPVLGSEKNDSGKSTVKVASTLSINTSISSTDNEVKTGVLNSWSREDAVFGEDCVRSATCRAAVGIEDLWEVHLEALLHLVGFPWNRFLIIILRGHRQCFRTPISSPFWCSSKGHPNNGEFYRPPIPGPFIRTNMPVRPGFYPGPLPYDGYFGPQLRYRSPNEQDFAFTGMAPGVSPYCRHPSAENGNSNARPAGFDGKISSSVEAELGHLRESGGQYKVLLKQHDSWEEEGKNCSRETPKLSQRSTLVDLRLLTLIVTVSWSKYTRVPETVLAHADDVDPARRSMQKRSAPEVSQSVSATAKDSSLIQKIESLNAKSRASDTRSDALPPDRRDQDAFPHRPVLPYSAAEITNESQVVNTNLDTRNFTPEHSGQVFAGGGKIHGRNAVGGAVMSRPYPQGGRGTAQQRGRRVGTPDASEWHKNPISVDSVVPSMETLNILPNTEVGDHSVSHPLKNDGESKPVATDLSDTPAERARLKELAKQRARRRQEEEEERARDQKARAHLKLEELNKRRQLEESLNAKTDSEQHGLHAPPEKAKDSTIILSQGSISETSPVRQIDERVTGVEGSTIFPGDQVSIRRQPPHFQQGVSSAGAIEHNPENMSYKHSRVVSKEKPTVSGELENWNDRTADVAKSDELLDDINPGTEKMYHSNPQNVVETTVHHRRKGSRTIRTKQRVDNLSPASVPINAVSEASRASTPEDDGLSKSLKPDLESKFIQQMPDSKDSKESTEHPLAPSTVTAQARFSFHGGSQHTRRTPRNQQTNKLSEKMHGSDAVMWAPRSQNKVEVAVETNDGTPAEEPNSSLKNDVGQRNAKHKRTEMERYIPKPVAKEMAQQGYASQAVPLNSKSGQVEETFQGTSSVSQSIANVQSQKHIQERPWMAGRTGLEEQRYHGGNGVRKNQ
ncbi:hypothetical protein MLD38_039430 [Melastoma candidum]|uniref:Uncharacterized protein n=1 Tax=Melastoma candidum TaxID=119954 RepID=A0ACB9L2H7_9MYRT|nr:hypothetical protein MLD38_039430 [Melastoma candidum]